MARDPATELMMLLRNLGTNRMQGIPMGTREFEHSATRDPVNEAEADIIEEEGLEEEPLERLRRDISPDMFIRQMLEQSRRRRR